MKKPSIKRLPDTPAWRAAWAGTYVERASLFNWGVQKRYFEDTTTKPTSPKAVARKLRAIAASMARDPNDLEKISIRTSIELAVACFTELMADRHHREDKRIREGAEVLEHMMAALEAGDAMAALGHLASYSRLAIINTSVHEEKAHAAGRAGRERRVLIAQAFDAARRSGSTIAEARAKAAEKTGASVRAVADATRTPGARGRPSGCKKLQTS